MRSSLPDLEAELATDEEGRSYSMTLTYKGPLTQRSLEGMVVVSTTSKEEHTLSIPIFVQIR